MSIQSLVQWILLEMPLPEGESMQDVVIDAQEYALEQLIEKVAGSLSPENILLLDSMIADDMPVEKIDQRLQENAPSYDEHFPSIEKDVIEYLKPATDEYFEDEDFENLESEESEEKPTI